MQHIVTSAANKAQSPFSKLSKSQHMFPTLLCPLGDEADGKPPTLAHLSLPALLAPAGGAPTPAAYSPFLAPPP
jgi:hypothetical protein